MKVNRKVVFNIQNTNSLITNGYYTLLIFLTLVVFALPMINTVLLRLALYLFIILNVGLFILSLLTSNKIKRDNYSINIILLTIFALFISVLFFGSFDIETISAIIGYLSSFLIAYYSAYIPTTKKTVNFIAGVCVVLSLIFIYFYFSPVAYRYTDINNDFRFYTDSSSGSLTLGFSNPNTTASLLLPVFMTILVLFKIYNSGKIKFAFFILSLILFYYIYLTDSRATFFSALIFIVIILSGVKIRISKLLISIVISSGLIFVFIYSMMYQSNIGHDWMILGKPLYSGRQEFMILTFFEAAESWLFGDIGKYQFGNLLNGMLSVFASGGIISIILYVLFFSHNISRRFHKNNNFSYSALIGLLIIYFQSYAEGNFMVTGAYFSTSLSMLYVLSNVKATKIYKLKSVK